jgi:hypothetical protein
MKDLEYQAGQEEEGEGKQPPKEQQKQQQVGGGPGQPACPASRPAHHPTAQPAQRSPAPAAPSRDPAQPRQLTPRPASCPPRARVQGGPEQQQPEAGEEGEEEEEEGGAEGEVNADTDDKYEERNFAQPEAPEDELQVGGCRCWRGAVAGAAGGGGPGRGEASRVPGQACAAVAPALACWLQRRRPWAPPTTAARDATPARPPRSCRTT